MFVFCSLMHYMTKNAARYIRIGFVMHNVIHFEQFEQKGIPLKFVTTFSTIPVISNTYKQNAEGQN